MTKPLPRNKIRLQFFLILSCLSTAFWTETAADQLSVNFASVHQSVNEYEVEQRLDMLLLLIQKRLAIMHEVARTKWNENLSIEDKLREQQVLTELKSHSNAYGLEDSLVESFFQAQINASKEIQKRDFILWKESGVLKFEKTFDLKLELRSYIDRLNHEILLLLSKIYSKPSEIKSDYILDRAISKRHSDYIENDIWLDATSPLRK